ncbi:MAG: DUF3488 and transglutaminase-like domain-containing protein [Chthoniobacterales bacterium]
MKTKSFYHLPLSSLQWLLTGLFLAALPLWFQLKSAIIFSFLGCLVWRFILERKGLKCPGLWVRCGVGVIGVLMLYGLNGTLIGLEAGMGLLLFLIALKVLEMRTEREFMLLGFLAFFILLTSLFFSQTLLVCVYVCAVFIVLTATIVQFTGGAAEGFRLRSLLRYTGMLVLQTLPLVVLFFVFLPRIKGGSLLQINKPKGAQSGMSEQINPGSFAELAQNDEVAFRVDFPDGVMPPYNELYWRVAVFTDCHGLSWRADKRERQNIMAKPRLTGPIVTQRISMEPHSGFWVYSLDRPLAGSGPVSMVTGNVLSLNVPTQDRLNIRVISQLGNDHTPMSGKDQEALTQVPPDIAPRSRQMVNSWLQKTRQPKELAGLALALFRKEKFRYTLLPGTYSPDGLDEFLFDRKLGFCEHYAAAFATLMRMAGVPTRMVAGYHGGEPNPFSNYLIVRQADAHAWVEIWSENDGWQRIDPVDSINPLRVDPDTPLASRFPVETASGNETGTGRNSSNLVQSLLRGARLGWDTVNFQWNLHVVSYDQESQRDFYKVLGIRSLFSWRLISILLGGMLAVLGVVWFLVRQKPEKPDRSLILYREFCRLLARHGLARHGLARHPNEGPLDFADRVRNHFPEHSEKLAAVFDLFIGLRYGSADSRPQERQIQLLLKELRRTLRRTKTPIRV